MIVTTNLLKLLFDFINPFIRKVCVCVYFC